MVCPAGERWKELVHKGARTMSEIQSLTIEPARKNFGCLRMPIFRSIPLDHVIIDTLCLLLRIADLLIDLLILELRHQDGIDSQTRPLKKTHLASYEAFLNEECKISFQWYAEEQKLKYGPVQRSIDFFKKINIGILFPSTPKAGVMDFLLWYDANVKPRM